MDLSIGDRVFYTRSNGLQSLATVVGMAEDGLLHLEYYQDGLTVVNRQCKMESMSFATPSSTRHLTALHLRRPTHSQVPAQRPLVLHHATKTGKVPLKVLSRARGKLACAGGGGVMGAPRRRGGGSGNGAPVTEPLVKYQSPRTEVVSSSAGADVVYPPFLGSFA